MQLLTPNRRVGLLITLLIGLAGCAGMTHRERNTALGATAGGAAGAVLGGGTVGTVGGAVIGGVLGHELSNDKKSGKH